MNQEMLSAIFKRCKNLKDLFALTDDLQTMGMQSPHPHGDEIAYLCPAHHEKQRSFYVNVETGEFFCQACKFTGWIGKLISHINPDVDPKECYIMCRRIMGDNTRAYVERSVFKDKNYYIDKARSATIKYSSNKDDMTIENIRPDPDYIVQFRNSINGVISKEEVESNGLVLCDYKVHQNTSKRTGIIMPMGVCPKPEDDISSGLFQIRQTNNDKVRYVNVSRLNFLGGVCHSIKRPGLPMVLTEGRFDEIRLRSRIGDVCNVASTFSSHISDEQWGIIFMLSDDIIISFDDDDAGKKAYDRIVNSKIASVCGVSIRSYFNDTMDWGSCPEEDFEKIRSFL